MSLIAHSAVAIDCFHCNGDPFWDGDQTLYEVDVADGRARDVVLVAVPRGNAFVPADEVCRYVQRLNCTVGDMQALAKPPARGHRPQIALSIEPGND